MFGVTKIDVAHVVYNSPIDFFRHAHIKTPIAGFHVKHRNLAAFGRNNGQTTISIAKDQHSLGPLLFHYGVRLGDGFANCFGRIATRCFQVILRTRHTELLKENIV